VQVQDQDQDTRSQGQDETKTVKILSRDVLRLPITVHVTTACRLP